MEEEAQDYLMDLIDRNLLVVADRRSNGGIKSCFLHDLLRELCLKKATEEKFLKKIMKSDSNPFSDSTSSIENQRRLFIDYEVVPRINSQDYPTPIRSLLFLHNLFEYRTTKWAPSFLLLRVLDLLNIPMLDFVTTPKS